MPKFNEWRWNSRAGLKFLRETTCTQLWQIAFFFHNDGNDGEDDDDDDDDEADYGLYEHRLWHRRMLSASDYANIYLVSFNLVTWTREGKERWRTVYECPRAKRQAYTNCLVVAHLEMEEKKKPNINHR